MLEKKLGSVDLDATEGKQVRATTNRAVAGSMDLDAPEGKKVKAATS